ncbi:STAS domain-containing protein [Marinomonas pollencensis]|uniref:Anti-anti-sigma factor n=1 Tax=Marinomonas pollencensis TaxID=491954 RepID=A0A3E0DRL4_9GAMM|nr:STAS domain-containing protein [Marinomonas pollencensis]REG85698.1 anti-anti-sigma factor [Marinomonas pollencensis]
MSISVTADSATNTIEISVLGSFDFSLFHDFREAYADFIGEQHRFCVDLSQVEYLDSAALGMLLSMKNALGEGVTIELKGANDFIKNILMISRFDKRFEIR